MILIFKLVFYVSLICIEYLATTTIRIEAVQNNWDKLNHFVAFVVLYMLFSFAYCKVKTSFKIFWLILFAVQIEIVQYFIPNRYFSLLDIFADVVGILFGFIIYTFLKIYILEKNEKFYF